MMYQQLTVQLMLSSKQAAMRAKLSNLAREPTLGPVLRGAALLRSEAIGDKTV
jgi:hypothetical protein